MNDEQTQLLTKAKENIAAARILVDRDFTEISASRAYYAMFYLATAMLLGEDKRFKKHSAVMAAFGRDITQTGLLPAELHGWLLDAAKARNVSDYQSSQSISQDEASAHIERAEHFLAAVKAALENEQG